MFAFLNKEKKTKESSIPGLLGLGEMAKVSINLLDFELASKDLLVSDVKGEMIIQKYGAIKIDGRTTIHRYYDGEQFIQIVTEGAFSDENILSVELFKEHDHIPIAAEDQKHDWIGDSGMIGDSEFFIITEGKDGEGLEVPYGRTIASDVDTKIDPLEMTETIHFCFESEQTVAVKHKCSSYGREVTGHIDELLFISYRDDGSSHDVSINVGIPIQAHTLQII